MTKKGWIIRKNQTKNCKNISWKLGLIKRTQKGAHANLLKNDLIPWSDLLTFKRFKILTESVLKISPTKYWI